MKMERVEFREALELLDRFADQPHSVYVFGETGTGKELAAKRIHAKSRRPGAFVACNCASLPRELVESTLFGHERGAFTGASRASEGLFREAHRGTLFLDELGEMPLDLQAKLLRVLDTGEVRPVGSSRVTQCDVRVVVATNRDLSLASTAGAFRSDLFARISTYRLSMPPLRERHSDIPT